MMCALPGGEQLGVHRTAEAPQHRLQQPRGGGAARPPVHPALNGALLAKLKKRVGWHKSPEMRCRDEGQRGSHKKMQKNGNKKSIEQTNIQYIHECAHKDTYVYVYVRVSVVACVSVSASTSLFVVEKKCHNTSQLAIQHIKMFKLIKLII